MQKNLLKKIFLKKTLLTFIGFILPVISSAQTGGDSSGGFVKCGGSGEEMCTLDHFFAMIVEVMRWGFRIGVSIATLMFAYAGLLIMTSGTNPERRAKAKGIFLNSAIGIVIMFISYGVIWFILQKLGVEAPFRQFLLG